MISITDLVVVAFLLSDTVVHLEQSVIRPSAKSGRKTERDEMRRFF